MSDNGLVIPELLKPFVSLGMDLDYKEGSKELKTECPFCHAHAWFLCVKDTRWQCHACGKKGNAIEFMREVWEHSIKATKETDKESELLAKERRLLSTSTIIRWGVCRSIITNKWLIPSQNHDGKLHQLYRYARIKDKEGNWVSKLLPLPSIHKEGEGHALSGRTLFRKDKPSVYICEGVWDGMALWEVLQCSKMIGDGKLGLTSSESLSMASFSNVVTTPGANVFLERWCRLFSGKDVVICFDNDHEKTHKVSGGKIVGAGYTGAKRISQILAKYEQPPSSIKFLDWGVKDASTFDSSLPSGTDLRDYLSGKHLSKRSSDLPTTKERVSFFQELLSRVSPIPSDWVGGRATDGVITGSISLQAKECTSWSQLMQSFRKAMKRTEGLEYALSVMLAACTLVKMPGDQLWIMLVGPPSSGKSSLCEAISANTRYVYANSILTGFISGYRSDKEGKEDHSLAVKIRNKCFITKDSDTLLKAPNKEQILSQARDLYDRVIRSHYGHGINRNQEGVNVAWLLCGTFEMTNLDISGLGQRFLTCVLADGVDLQVEDSVNNRKMDNLCSMFSGTSEDSGRDGESAEMVEFKQFTSGYVDYLCEDPKKLFARVEQIPDSIKEEIKALGTFAAFMRSRPSPKQDEQVQREFSYRLVSQHLRLAYSLAVVLGSFKFDELVMARVRRVAMDTSRGVTLKICKYLHTFGSEGVTPQGVHYEINQTVRETNKLLRFLKSIEAAEGYLPNPRRSGLVLWRLAPGFLPLYERVMCGKNAPTSSEQELS